PAGDLDGQEGELFGLAAVVGRGGDALLADQDAQPGAPEALALPHHGEPRLRAVVREPSPEVGRLAVLEVGFDVGVEPILEVTESGPGPFLEFAAGHLVRV